MAVEDSSRICRLVRAAALATSKRWMRENSTVRFAQEVHDQAGRLVAVHEKFPVDLGHKEL